MMSLMGLRIAACGLSPCNEIGLNLGIEKESKGRKGEEKEGLCIEPREGAGFLKRVSGEGLPDQEEGGLHPTRKMLNAMKVQPYPFADSSRRATAFSRMFG